MFDVKAYIKLQEEMEEQFGAEKLQKIVESIEIIIKDDNLQYTPHILKDLFDYTRLTIFCSAQNV